MSKKVETPFVSMSFPRWIWERIYPILGFIEEQGEEGEVEYKVWVKGTPEPEMPGIPEVEG